MAQNRESGTIAKYDLRYLRRDNGLYTQNRLCGHVGMEQATLKSMMGSYLQIGLAAHGAAAGRFGGAELLGDESLWKKPGRPAAPVPLRRLPRAQNAR
jgi:hypothetical protein